MWKNRDSSYQKGLLDYLLNSGITMRELRGQLSTKLLRRLPRPPGDRAFYELGDRGPGSVRGLWIRKGKKAGVTFYVRADMKPKAAKKFVSVRVKIGQWSERDPAMSLKIARERAALVKSELRHGEDLRCKTIGAKAKETQAAFQELTLRSAYKLYLNARTGKKRKPLSPATQADYTRVIERGLVAFADRPLRELAEDPRPLIAHFDEVSLDRPAEANTRMRVVRAVWNRAHKIMPLQAPAPPAIFDMNEVEARDAGFVMSEMPALWRAICAIQEPIRKKAILTFLFLGLRDGAVLPMHKSHVDADSRTLTIPYTKGKRLVLPLSRAAHSLLEAPVPESLVNRDNPFMLPSARGPRPGKRKAPLEGEVVPWAHVDGIDCSDLPIPTAYVKQRGDKANCHPHVFRHTYRTLATSANVADVAIRLLMGHSLKGDVSFGYLTADVEWLRAAQEQVSAHILKCCGMRADFVFPYNYFLGREAAHRASSHTRESEQMGLFDC